MRFDVSQGENAIYEGHGVSKKRGETSAAVRGQMAADRAPVYHDSGDLQADSVSIPFSWAERMQRMCQLNQRALT